VGDEYQLTNGAYRFPGAPNLSLGVFLKAVSYVDLNNDGRDEALIVLDEIDNGSDGMHALFYIYECRKGRVVLSYSGDYERADSITIQGKSVVIVAPEWVDDDPHCCPTYQATLVLKYRGSAYRVIRKSLTRLPPPPQSDSTSNGKT